MRSWSIVLPNDLPAATPLPLLLIEAWSALAEWALLVKTSLQHCSRPRGHSDCDCKKKPSLRSSLLECVNCADCNHHQRPFSALKLIGWSRSMYLHQSGYYWLKAELDLALLTKCRALTEPSFSRANQSNRRFPAKRFWRTKVWLAAHPQLRCLLETKRYFTLQKKP